VCVCVCVYMYKNTWMQDRAREIQEYADTNNMEAFFAAVKKIYDLGLASIT